mmetsp:Transcript_2001/g.3546  ORF Transcript_2001/g.3546 Transcript_2001/m.3546 type:complete len:186 (-) Transcript_2001:393-950(-)
MVGSVKVHMNVIIDWINTVLSPSEPTESTLKMNSLYRCVSLKSFEEIYQPYNSNCKLSITGCEESLIYVDANVDTLLIASCINCTIYVAAVSKICTVEKCEKVTVCVATNQLRIGSSVDSTIHSYTPSFPPVVYGDTRNLRFGPHNASYPLLSDHLKRAAIRFEKLVGEKEVPQDWFAEALNNFK